MREPPRRATAPQSCIGLWKLSAETRVAVFRSLLDHEDAAWLVVDGEDAGEPWDRDLPDLQGVAPCRMRREGEGRDATFFVEYRVAELDAHARDRLAELLMRWERLSILAMNIRLLRDREVDPWIVDCHEECLLAALRPQEHEVVRMHGEQDRLVAISLRES